MTDLVFYVGFTLGLGMSGLLAWSFVVMVNDLRSRDRRSFEAGRAAGAAEAKLSQASTVLDGLLYEQSLKWNRTPEDRSAAQASTEPQGDPIQSLSRWGQGETQNVGGSSMERRGQE